MVLSGWTLCRWRDGRRWSIVCAQRSSVRASPPPSGLPAISPTGGEIGWAHAPRFIRSGRDGRAVSSCRSPSLWGRWPAGQRGRAAYTDLSGCCVVPDVQRLALPSRSLRAATPCNLMLRWRVAPSKHPPHIPASSPQPASFEAPASPPHLSFDRLRMMDEGCCGASGIRHPTTCIHPTPFHHPSFVSSRVGCHTHRPHAEVGAKRPSKHPPRTPAPSPQPSSFEAPALPPHLRMRVALLRPAAQYLAPCPQHPATPSQIQSSQKPRPPLTQASPFTRQRLPVVCFILWSHNHSRPRVCRTGRCKLPRWVVYKWHLSAPRSALLAKQQFTCHGWQSPDGEGGTLPENRSDVFKVRPFPSGWRWPVARSSPCQFGCICLRFASAPIIKGRKDRSVFRKFLTRQPRQVCPLRSVRAVCQQCGADAACSCVPPDFRFNPHDRVRPEDDELSVHPATKLLADASWVTRRSVLAPVMRPGRASGG